MTARTGKNKDFLKGQKKVLPPPLERHMLNILMKIACPWGETLLLVEEKEML